MKYANVALFVLAAMTALAVVGCGGSSGGFSLNDPNAGSYTGSFTTSSGQSGTITATESNVGLVSGTLVNTTSGTSATLSGTFDDVLSGGLILTYPVVTEDTSGFLTLSGTTLSGTENLYDTDGALGTITITLTRSS